MDYKLYAFDYDDTIDLKNVNEIYKKEYFSKMFYTFKLLKEKEKKLVVISYNSNLINNLKNLNIYHYFDYFYSPKIVSNKEYCKNKNLHKENVVLLYNRVAICEDKGLILEKILKELHIQPKDAIFFDDNSYNIKSVNKIGVKSVLVDPTIGMSFEFFNENQT